MKRTTLAVALAAGALAVPAVALAAGDSDPNTAPAGPSFAPVQQEDQQPQAPEQGQPDQTRPDHDCPEGQGGGGDGAAPEGGSGVAPESGSGSGGSDTLL
jgi:hypothetical protein